MHLDGRHDRHVLVDHPPRDVAVEVLLAVRLDEGDVLQHLDASVEAAQLFIG